MNVRLMIVGAIAAVAGILGAVAFVPGAVDRLIPRGPVSVGKALIGGPFELTTHSGARVTDANFRGRIMLVNFGFTHCPDVCPAGLQVITAALDTLGADAGKVAPLFITVDPARDTVDQMRQYMESFHTSIVGLTGSAGDIDKAAKAYRVYYRKVQDEALSDYTMDHSSFVYLMDGAGDFITHFPHNVPPAELAARLRTEIAKLP